MSDIIANRCRLILAVPPLENPEDALRQAMAGGDVASVMIAPNGLENHEYLAYCKNLVSIVQENDAAAIVAGDTQVAGRSDADGYLIEDGIEAIKDAVARFSPHKIVGCGNIRARHKALEIGECNPDFMFFGAMDKDIRPEPHKKNLVMGEWWSKMVEIPCAVMGGNTIESAIDVAQCGAEFVVLSKAVFEHADGASAAVKKVNEFLDEFGPRFDEE